MTVYMAWKKSDSTAIYLTSYNVGQWETEREAAEPVKDFATSAGPGLTIFNGRLFTVWNTPGGAVHWSILRDDGWTDQRSTRDFTTTGQPALLGNGMAWKGGDDQSIFWSTYDGQQWADRTQAMGMGTSVGPALAHYGGTPHMAWKGAIGRVNDQSIYWSTFGTSWASQQQVPGVGTNVGPTLAETRNGLLMTWKGAWDDNAIWWSIYDGRRWADQQVVPHARTDVGPALASTSTGGALMTWKAENDGSIWWTTFDNLQWADQRQVPGVDTSYRPALTLFDEG